MNYPGDPAGGDLGAVQVGHSCSDQAHTGRWSLRPVDMAGFLRQSFPAGRQVGCPSLDVGMQCLVGRWARWWKWRLEHDGRRAHQFHPADRRHYAGLIGRNVGQRNALAIDQIDAHCRASRLWSRHREHFAPVDPATPRPRPADAGRPDHGGWTKSGQQLEAVHHGVQQKEVTTGQNSPYERGQHDGRECDQRLPRSGWRTADKGGLADIRHVVDSRRSSVRPARSPRRASDHSTGVAQELNCCSPITDSSCSFS